MLSLGTLGGGNHFIELDVAKNGEVYLIVHTGSRHLGKEVAEYYMKAGQDELKDKGINDIPFEMTYLSGNLMEDYLHDLKIVEEYAILNRKIIAAEIIKKDEVEGNRRNFMFSQLCGFFQEISPY